MLNCPELWLAHRFRLQPLGLSSFAFPVTISCSILFVPQRQYAWRNVKAIDYLYKRSSYKSHINLQNFILLELVVFKLWRGCYWMNTCDTIYVLYEQVSQRLFILRKTYKIYNFRPTQRNYVQYHVNTVRPQGVINISSLLPLDTMAEQGSIFPLSSYPWLWHSGGLDGE